MSEDRSDHLSQGDPEDDFQPPDLGQLRALAEREELAAARARLADGLGHPLPTSDPNAPLARDVAASLTEAGFTLHNLRATSSAIPARRSMRTPDPGPPQS